MRAEISCLFHLEYHDDVVKEAHIGSGVYLQEILSNNWRDNLLTDMSANDALTETGDWRYLVKARQKLDWGPYTHRFYISLEDVTGSADSRIKEAKQLIMRSIVLSRIVHPTPIALGGTWIKTMYEDSGQSYHLPEIGVGFYSMAYVSPRSDKTLTQGDAVRMAELWEPLQHIHANEEKYRRMIRALKFFDGGYHIWNAEFRHIVFHSALAALICTSRDSIKAQIVQRLPRLVEEITERQALTIYNLYEDIKYAATPLQLKTVNSEVLARDDEDRSAEAELVADNEERLNAVSWLERSLRLLLERAIADQSFADLLSDREEFARQYPVEVNRSSIGDFIVRDPGVRGGRPIINATGVSVHRIASWYNLGLRPEEIAGRIGRISLAEVYAALAHYHANRDEIDAEIAAEEVEADRLEQEHYLSLQSRS